MSHKDALEALLSSRSVISAYSGPSPTQLAASVTRLVTQSVEWSHLVTEWDPGTHDTCWLLSHVSDQILYRPSLEDYTVTEVVESLLIQSCIKAIKVSVILFEISKF